MDLLVTIGAVLVAALLFYLSIPVLLFLLVDALFRFRGSRDADRVFDFFADLLYPWRWDAPLWVSWPRKWRRWRQRKKGMKTVTIYTDGACSGNPGPGGWGAILMYGPYKKELSGGEARTSPPWRPRRSPVPSSSTRTASTSLSAWTRAGPRGGGPGAG